MQRLNKCRKDIDKIDKDIINLLSKRMKIAKKIGNFKQKEAIDIKDKKREKEVLKRVKKYGKSQKIDLKFVEDLYKKIIENSRKIEKK